MKVEVTSKSSTFCEKEAKQNEQPQQGKYFGRATHGEDDDQLFVVKDGQEASVEHL